MTSIVTIASGIHSKVSDTHAPDKDLGDEDLLPIGNLGEGGPHGILAVS